VVHNLRHIARQNDGPPPLWASAYNDFFKQHLLANDLSPLIEWQSSHPDVKMAVPTAEHYLPLIYTLGLQKKSESATVITNGIELSAISMLSFGFGLPSI
jgi:4,5-DOPA dioxygenase extradiol